MIPDNSIYEEGYSEIESYKRFIFLQLSDFFLITLHALVISVIFKRTLKRKALSDSYKKDLHLYIMDIYI